MKTERPRRPPAPARAGHQHPRVTAGEVEEHEAGRCVVQKGRQQSRGRYMKGTTPNQMISPVSGQGKALVLAFDEVRYSVMARGDAEGELS